MARRVFVSFRFSDGNEYKKELVDMFDEETEIINCSEDKDRSDMTEDTIQKYLYAKLRTTSVTIVILTPEAIEHRKDCFGRYDDWMYDEIRYSLEDREYNRCNGIIAVYTKEAKGMIMQESIHKCEVCNKESKVSTIFDFNNLCRKNMMNIKQQYKTNPCQGIYDLETDSYCTLVSWEEFKKEYKKYIDSAAEKREDTYKFKLTKRL